MRFSSRLSIIFSFLGFNEPLLEFLNENNLRNGYKILLFERFYVPKIQDVRNDKKRFGDEERRLMHLVPAPAVRQET